MFGSRCLLSVSVALFASALAAFPPDPEPIRIGVLATIFRGAAKPAMLAVIKKPIVSEVEARTGFDCELEVALTHNDLRRKLADGRLHFGLCPGFEFAWMQSKDDKIKALMIAVPDHEPLKAVVVVRSDNSAKELCDLKGKSIAVPKGTDASVDIFVSRRCRCGEKTLPQFAGTVTWPDTSETALHQLYDDKIQAAIVDDAALRAFAERFPARSEFIRVLLESDAFPLSVVAYREGNVDSATLLQFQNAMKKAKTYATGRQLMALLHSRGFESVPADFQKQLAHCLKLYPTPAEATK
jgi:ABC-type phosphate/phosphonate transport system substrate-binding protein